MIRTGQEGLAVPDRISSAAAAEPLPQAYGPEARLRTDRIARQSSDGEEPLEPETGEGDREPNGNPDEEPMDIPFEKGDEKNGLAQLRWRKVFWVNALYGFWFFLPLLTVFFHKLATDHVILSAVKIRHLRYLLLAEWIAISVMIALVGMVYLAVIAILVLIVHCATSPIECVTQGLNSFFGQQ